jgi:hypothetical protein
MNLKQGAAPSVFEKRLGPGPSTFSSQVGSSGICPGAGGGLLLLKKRTDFAGGVSARFGNCSMRLLHATVNSECKMVLVGGKGTQIKRGGKWFVWFDDHRTTEKSYSYVEWSDAVIASSPVC